MIERSYTTTEQRRRAWVMRYACPYCLVDVGVACAVTDGSFVRGTAARTGEFYSKGDPYAPGLHVNRFKRAAKAAMDALIASDGVAFDEDGAVDEAEVRASEPEKRPHLAQRATVRRAA